MSASLTGIAIKESLPLIYLAASEGRRTVAARESANPMVSNPMGFSRGIDGSAPSRFLRVQCKLCGAERDREACMLCGNDLQVTQRGLRTVSLYSRHNFGTNQFRHFFGEVSVANSENLRQRESERGRDSVAGHRYEVKSSLTRFGQPSTQARMHPLPIEIVLEESESLFQIGRCPE